VSENSADPRVGAAIQIPHLRWVLRGSMGRLLSRPPLVTEQSSHQSDIPFRCMVNVTSQHEFGSLFPLKAGHSTSATFRTEHVISSITMRSATPISFSPLALSLLDSRLGNHRTVAQSGWPRAIPSAYSHHTRMVGRRDAASSVATRCDTLCFLDHDQRDTLTGGFDVSLPRRSSADFNVTYGSGF